MLQIYEWSGWQQQVVRHDWTAVDERGRPRRIAGGLAGQRRSFEQYPTALGFALLFGGQSLATQDCAKRTLDLAGDGTNNDGVSPEVARRDLPVPGITINGLVIGANVETLGRYYQQFVIQGPGAFVEVATDYEDFERAMRRKLLRELGVIEMSGPPGGGCGRGVRRRELLCPSRGRGRITRPCSQPEPQRHVRRVLPHQAPAALRLRRGQPAQGPLPRRGDGHHRLRHGQPGHGHARRTSSTSWSRRCGGRGPTAIRRRRASRGCAGRRPATTRAASA